MSQTKPGSDPIYKRLYAFAEMVEDLLCSVCPPEMLGAVDWPSLGRLPASYVGDDFRERHGDAVWRVRLCPAGGREEWHHVLVLLEYLCCKGSLSKPPLLKCGRDTRAPRTRAYGGGPPR